MYKYLKLPMIAATCLLLGAGCTKLEEETFGSLSPDTYYRNEE